MASAYCSPSRDGRLGSLRIHDAGGQEGHVAVAGHPGRLVPGVARLACGAHAIAHATFVVSVDDLDPTEEDLRVEHGLTVAEAGGQRAGLDGSLSRRRKVQRQEQALGLQDHQPGPQALAFRRGWQIGDLREALLPRRRAGSRLARRGGARRRTSRSAALPRRLAVPPPDRAGVRELRPSRHPRCARSRPPRSEYASKSLAFSSDGQVVGHVRDCALIQLVRLLPSRDAAGLVRCGQRRAERL